MAPAEQNAKLYLHNRFRVLCLADDDGTMTRSWEGEVVKKQLLPEMGVLFPGCTFEIRDGTGSTSNFAPGKRWGWFGTIAWGECGIVAHKLKIKILSNNKFKNVYDPSLICLIFSVARLNKYSYLLAVFPVTRFLKIIFDNEAKHNVWLFNKKKKLFFN